MVLKSQHNSFLFFNTSLRFLFCLIFLQYIKIVDFPIIVSKFSKSQKLFNMDRILIVHLELSQTQLATSWNIISNMQR